MKKIVKYLIKRGGDISQETSTDNNILSYACGGENEVIVKYLINLGVDIEKEN